ncbi:MAG: class I SAM-dependent methyltransferase [Myxococcota bacterium]
MTSTQAEIDRSYSVSNEFFKLWLDENMHYTSAAFDRDDMTLEEAQENKARVLYDFAELDDTKTVLDIGCGWGSAIDCRLRFGVREAHGITLSTEQLAYRHERGLPADKAKFILVDYAEYEPAEKYDALISVEMIDHPARPPRRATGSPSTSTAPTSTGWPGGSSPAPPSASGHPAQPHPARPQGPRRPGVHRRRHLPGRPQPRIEELVQAISPNWELERLIMRRRDYGKTTAEWLRRMRLHEQTIRSTWGDQLFDDYERYLDTCVRGFANHWSGDVQMKLRRI